MATADPSGPPKPTRLEWVVAGVIGLSCLTAWPAEAGTLARSAAGSATSTPAPDSPSRLSPPIPQEPSEYDAREIDAFYDWRNDLFFRHFDMAGGGKADFMTARRTYKVWTNDFGNPVVLTMANPLFYWVDLDADGEFEPNRGEMWTDPEEDGVNGNERLYDVPEDRTSRPPPYPFRPRSSSR